MNHDKLIKQIKKAETDHADFFRKGEAIVDRYSDKRTQGSQYITEDRRMNILWSNVQILRPSYFAAMPVPVAKRRYGDDDPVSLEASIVLQKALEYSLDENSQFNAINNALLDRLLVGRGVVRVSYDADVDYDGDEPIGTQNEKVKMEYVHWQDFLIADEPRFWEEVDTIIFKAYMTTEEIQERFDVLIETSKVDIEQTSLNTLLSNKKKGKIEVCEVWCKSKNKVYFISKEHPNILEESEPLIDFVDFFPCPMPMCATLTTDSIIPVPDFVLYQDQADEIDLLSSKINQIIQALKVAGIYAGDNPDIKRLITASNNEMIPIADWQMIAGKGGVKGLIEWLPLTDILVALEGMYKARDAIKEEIYEITGISDIIRGQGKANETATAQRIKGRFATIRLQQQQGITARFCRDAICLMSEVISGVFNPDTLSSMTNEQIQPEVYDLLHNEDTLSYRVDIEIDSTIRMDEQEEVANRLNFLKQAGSFLVEMQPIIQASPEMGKLIGEMFMFGVRTLRHGRELEMIAKETIEQIGQMDAPESQESKENALQDKQAQAQSQQQQMQAQQQQQQMQMQAQMKQQEMQMKQQELQHKQQLEVAKFQQTAQKAQVDQQQAQVDNQLKFKELSEKEKQTILKARELEFKATTGRDGI